MPPKKVRTGIIGCGGISRFHIRNMFKHKNTEIVALCDPFQDSIDKLVLEFKASGKKVPPNESDIQKFLKTFELDAVLIATNHTAFDYDQIVRHATLVIDTRNATAGVGEHREKIRKA